MTHLFPDSDFYGLFATALLGSESIQANHIHEAINYRILDRSLWT